MSFVDLKIKTTVNILLTLYADGSNNLFAGYRFQDGYKKILAVWHVKFLADRDQIITGN